MKELLFIMWKNGIKITKYPSIIKEIIVSVINDDLPPLKDVIEKLLEKF